jgi:hypothetical protein
MLKIFRKKKKARQQSSSATLLGYARQALENGQVARARIHLGFGEIMAGENGGSIVEFLLDAGRLWLEFTRWPNTTLAELAYDRFLEAEWNAKDPLLHEATQSALLDLESTFALGYAANDGSPHTGFWTCLAARRQGMQLDLPLKEAWRRLQESTDTPVEPGIDTGICTRSCTGISARKRALEGVEIFATAKTLGHSIGSLDEVAGYVARAPECLSVLQDLQDFAQSLYLRNTLDTVTKPWLEVLDAVNPKALPRATSNRRGAQRG